MAKHLTLFKACECYLSNSRVTFSQLLLCILLIFLTTFFLSKPVSINYWIGLTGTNSKSAPNPRFYTSLTKCTKWEFDRDQIYVKLNEEKNKGVQEKYNCMENKLYEK